MRTAKPNTRSRHQYWLIPTERLTTHDSVTAKGRLVSVSRDAVQDEKLGPIYVAHLSIEEPSVDSRAAGVEVTPGMAATAEIRTDERRVIDYLLSPIERRVREVGRER